MKIAPAVIAALLQALACCNAYAHGDHKPKHGGIMGRGDDEISVELVMEKGTALLYVEDESGTPLPTANSLPGIVTRSAPAVALGPLATTASDAVEPATAAAMRQRTRIRCFMVPTFRLFARGVKWICIAARASGPFVSIACLIYF